MEIDNNENQNIISSTEMKSSNDISPTQIINQSDEEIKLNTINKTSKDIENIEINNSSSDISPTQIVNSSNDVSPTQIIQSSEEVITNKNTTSKDINLNTTNNNGQYVMKCKIPTIDKQINSLMKLIGCGQNDNGNWIIDNDIDNKSLKKILDILNEKITIKNRVNNEFIDDNVIYDSDEEIINEGKKNLILEEKEKRIQKEKEKEKELEEDTESETDTEPETTLLKGYDSDAATDDEENKIEV